MQIIKRTPWERRPGEARWEIAGWLLVFALLVAVMYFWWRADPGVASETGAFEWGHAGLFLVAGVVFGAKGIVATAMISRLAASWAAILMLSFMLRELDLESGPVIALLLDEYSAHITVVMWLGWGLFAWRHARDLVLHIVVFMKSRAGWLMAIAAVFLIGSWPMDRLNVDLFGLNYMFVEEAAETLAAVALVMSACYYRPAECARRLTSATTGRE